MKTRRTIIIAVFFLIFGGRAASTPGAPERSQPGRASAWTPIGPPGGDVRAIARNPKSPNELFAVTYSGQVFRSADNGASWTRKAVLPNTQLLDVAVSPSASTTIYALSTLGLLVSTDRGVTFIERRFPSGALAGNGKLAVHPSNPAMIFVGGVAVLDQKLHLAVLKTINGGKTWTLSIFEETGVTAEGRGIALAARNPAVVYYCGYFDDYAGRNEGRFYRSTDSGKTWKNLTPDLLSGAWSFIDALAVDPGNPGKVYLGCRSATWRGVARSSDFGGHWARQSSPESFQIEAIALDPSQPGVLCAGGRNGAYEPAFFKSADGGVNWAESEASLIGKPQDLLVSGATVHLASGGGVFRSVNGGSVFKTGNIGIKASLVEAFALASSSDARLGSARTLYAASYEWGVMKSSDGGGSWTRLSPLPGTPESTGYVTRYIAVPAADPRRVYVSTDGYGLFRSEDGGTAFALILSADYRRGRVIPLVRPTDADGILAACSVRAGGKYVLGALLSSDGGKTWSQVKIRKDDHSYASAAAMAPSDTATIYLAGMTSTDAPCFYRSTNGGAGWTPVAAPASGYFGALTVAPDSPNTVYAGGMSGQGIYKSADGGSTWTKVADSPVNCRSLVIHPARPKEIFAAGDGLYYSGDGGETWTSLGTGLPLPDVYGLALDPAARRIYASTWGGGIVRRSF